MKTKYGVYYYSAEVSKKYVKDQEDLKNYATGNNPYGINANTENQHKVAVFDNLEEALKAYKEIDTYAILREGWAVDYYDVKWKTIEQEFWNDEDEVEEFGDILEFDFPELEVKEDEEDEDEY